MSPQKTPLRSFSRPEAFELIAAYFESGVRPCDFYSHHQMSESQFYSWRRRYLDAKRGDQFHPVRFESSSESKTALVSGLAVYVLDYPNGVKLTLPSCSDSSLLLDLINNYH